MTFHLKWIIPISLNEMEMILFRLNMTSLQEKFRLIFWSTFQFYFLNYMIIIVLIPPLNLNLSG
jgi:hypothetical protein